MPQLMRRLSTDAPVASLMPTAFFTFGSLKAATLSAAGLALGCACGGAAAAGAAGSSATLPVSIGLLSTFGCFAAACCLAAGAFAGGASAVRGEVGNPLGKSI